MKKTSNLTSRIEKFFYLRILRPLIFTSRIGRRAILGRAGRGLFVEYVYQDKASGYNKFGYLIDKILLRLPTAKATKEKKDQIMKIVQEEITKNTLNNKVTKIADLGSGSARYLIELSKDKTKDQVQSICLDIDKSSLNYGRQIAKGYPIEYRLGNIIRLNHYKRLSQKINWKPNIVIVSTCYEFLSDGIVRASLEEIYKIIDSGGLLIIVSQSRNPNKKLFDNLATLKDDKPWNVYYRKPNTIKKWMMESGFKNIQISLDRYGMYCYSVGRKTGITINRGSIKPVLLKCDSYSRYFDTRASDTYYYMRGYDVKANNGKVVVGDNKAIMFASNDYFGLTNRREVIETSILAIKQYGSSTASSRLTRGTLELHEELEGELAEFINVEDVIVFSTGYMANVGAISGLINKGDAVFIDRSAHASILDGARLSEGGVRFFPHNSLTGLERLLRNHAKMSNKLIACDGVYSMDGDLAPLPEICNLAEKYNSAIAVDDGHATGIFGENGRGTVEYFKVEGKVDVILGSLGKALASVGGFAAGNHSIIEYLRYHARSFVFSTSLSPVHVAMTLAALRILKSEPELREHLWANTYMLKENLRSMGFNIGATQSPIIPIIIGEEAKTFKMVQMLEEYGVIADPIVFPAVKKDKCRIRLRATAVHKPLDIEKALLVFKKVGKEFGVI
jgi:8-amino-7-oxononanoate synthase